MVVEGSSSAANLWEKLGERAQYIGRTSFAFCEVVSDQLRARDNQLGKDKVSPGFPSRATLDPIFRIKN